MRYVGGGVGHHPVDIPPEDEVPAQSNSDDEDSDVEPNPMDQTPIPPPGTPELDEEEFPDHIELPRSGSSLSETSEHSNDSNETGSGSDPGDDDELDEPELDRRTATGRWTMK
ncbi:hypothetical protein B0H14DRAFT_2565472 [Mycena olivaceomarginata]|nr:hypothetical protein B0H14DRAFT_2565472 [Mycena olivaceomarginata]